MKFSICLLILLPFSVRGQNIVSIISNTVGLISWKHENSIKIGTGTVVTKKITDSSLFVFIVTNRHTLPSYNQASHISFKIKDPINKDKFIETKIPIFTSIGKLSNNIKFDPDSNDLAIINISGLLNRDTVWRRIVNTTLTSIFLQQKIL